MTRERHPLAAEHSRVLFCRRGVGSESKSQLSLEGSPSRLGRRQPEIIAVDAERRRCRCWVIQDVRGVHAYLERFALRNPERLAEVSVESDRTQTLNRILSESALFAREWVLEHNLDSLPVDDGRSRRS